VFLRMLSLNKQRTFDGATPRRSRPTLASGEHGAPVQGWGLGGIPINLQNNARKADLDNSGCC
jgi:hypothetical protein